MSYIQNYFHGVKSLMDHVPEELVEELTTAMEDVWKRSGRTILMGNGGSSSSASHIVNDLQKCIFTESGKPLKALCLTDNVPLIVAWGNDTEFANIFAPQVECWAEPGDLVIGISGSGNSENVIRGIQKANEKKAMTFGLAGYGGGRLAEVAQKCIVLDSRNMQQIEDMHLIILHLVFSALRERVRKA